MTWRGVARLQTLSDALGFRRSGHTTDTEWTDVLAGDEVTEGSAHRMACRDCANELDEFRALCAGVRAEADAAVLGTAHDRLARQRARVQHRIEAAAGPPARVLRFPSLARPSQRPRLDGTVRRLGIALAAGLVLGVTTGRLLDPAGRPASRDDVAAAPAPPEARTPSTPSAAGPVGPPVSTTLPGDDQLMAELERAVTTQRVPTLAALDGLTPRLRVVAVDVR